MKTIRILEKIKLINIILLIKNDINSWLYNFLNQYFFNRSSFIYIDFKVIIIRKYESNEVYNDYL